MRTILLTAALICAVIAAALGFRVIDLDVGLAELNRVTLAWGSWSMACFVASQFNWPRYDR